MTCLHTYLKKNRSHFFEPSGGFRGPTRVNNLAEHRDPLNSRVATATAHAHAQLGAYVRVEPSGVAKVHGNRAHDPLRDRLISTRKQSRSQPPRAKNRVRALSTQSAAALASAAARIRTTGIAPKSWPRCCWPHRLSSRHLPAAAAESCESCGRAVRFDPNGQMRAQGGFGLEGMLTFDGPKGHGARQP